MTARPENCTFIIFEIVKVRNYPRALDWSFVAKLEAQKYGTLDQLKRFQISGNLIVKVLGV